MKDDTRNYAIVGGFVVAMAVALVVWLALLAGRTGATDDYSIVYRNVIGLQSGVEILYEGFPVGHIEAIEPIDREGARSFRVRVSVKAGWPIPEDSVAAITAPGLLSSVVIDIRGGTSETPLAPGSEITGEEAADLFAAVNRVASEAMHVIEHDITPLLHDLGERTPAILTNVEQTTEALDQAAVNLAELLGPANASHVSRILGNLDGASSQTETLVGDLAQTRERVDQLITRVDGLVETQSGELAEAMAALNQSLEAAARHMDAIAANLEDTTRNLSEASGQVRGDPSLLIRGRSGGEDPQ